MLRFNGLSIAEVRVTPLSRQLFDLSFDCDASSLVESLDSREVAELVEAILDKHGADAFDSIADRLSDE